MKPAELVCISLLTLAPICGFGQAKAYVPPRTSDLSLDLTRPLRSPRGFAPSTATVHSSSSVNSLGSRRGGSSFRAVSGGRAVGAVGSFTPEKGLLNGFFFDTADT